MGRDSKRSGGRDSWGKGKDGVGIVDLVWVVEVVGGY